MIDLKNIDQVRNSDTIPTEDMEQVWLIQWAIRNASQYPELTRLHHIPNGGHRSKSQGAMLKLAGVKSGVPDLMLPVARHTKHGLYIELKRIKGGTVSKEQKDWLAYLNEAGYVAVVCKGFEEARDTILEYLNPTITYSPGVI